MTVLPRNRPIKRQQCSRQNTDNCDSASPVTFRYFGSYPPVSCEPVHSCGLQRLETSANQTLIAKSYLSLQLRSVSTSVASKCRAREGITEGDGGSAHVQPSYIRSDRIFFYRAPGYLAADFTDERSARQAHAHTFVSFPLGTPAETVLCYFASEGSPSIVGQPTAYHIMR